MTWLLLCGAIAFEVAATMCLRVSDGLTDKRWMPAVAGGYLVSFVFLTLVLRHGMALGVAYGVWAATGIALTAVFARAFFGDPLTRRMGVGLALIAAGVLLVEVGAASH